MPQVAILLAVVFWGLAPVAIRYLVSHLSPQDLLVLRFTLSGLLFIPLLRGVEFRRWSRKDIFLVAACSIAGVGGYNIPVTFGAQWVPASVTGLLIASEPIWIVLISMVAFRERPRWTLVLGLMLASLGVATLLGNASMLNVDASFFTGAGLILLGALMWAIYCILIPAVARPHGAIRSAALVQTLGVLPLIAFCEVGLLRRSAGLHSEAWIAIAFLAVFASAVSVVLWNYGLSRISSARAGIFLYLIPLITVLGGALLLDERIGLGEMLGGLMILAGVAVAQSSPLGAGSAERS